MMLVNPERMYSAINTLLLCMLCLIGCSKTEQNKGLVQGNDFKNLYPEQVSQIDQVDSLYFSFLGDNAFIAKDGSIILPVWDPAMLLKTKLEGSTVIAKTIKGKGPGETIDIGTPAMDDEGNLYVYDQMQSKVIHYNSSLEALGEVIVRPAEGYRVSQIHASFKNGKLLFEMKKSGLAFIDDQSKKLSLYDFETGEFEEELKVYSKPYEPIGDLLKTGFGMAIDIPFSNDQLVAYKPENKTFLLFDTRTNIIAEIDSKFDTLNVIKVNLPQEEMSKDEFETLKEKNEILTSKDWEGVKARIPELKAKASAMLYSNNEIWLKSNLLKEYDYWLVLDLDGNIKHAVNLPKDSGLSFVSGTYLGVRLDDSTFAIYTLN